MSLMSYTERQRRCMVIPPGFAIDEETRHRSRPFDARATCELAQIVGPVRVVEPGALVVGEERRKVITSDPGEHIQYAPGSVEDMSARFDASFVLTWHAGELRRGTVSGGAVMSEGVWPSLLTSYRAKATGPLTGPAALDSFTAAREAGFSAKEIETAFAGLPGVVAVVRDAVRETVLSHVKKLTGRQAALWYYRIAEGKLLNGFMEADLGPLVQEVFVEELNRNTAEMSLTELLDLVEALTGLEV